MSKIERMLKGELQRLNTIMVSPYVEGINYVAMQRESKYYANALYYVRINRSFIRLGLAAKSVA